MGGALAGCLSASMAMAQVASYGDKQGGENSGDQLPQVLQKVGVAQHLNQQLPLQLSNVVLGRARRPYGGARDGEAGTRKRLRRGGDQH